MDKFTRKKVHNFASAFNLNSKSVGSGKKRFPTLYKTSRTRPHVRGSGSAKAYGSGVVHHREGDIIGASAPEIGVENRGRKMLEKMGYISGMALGLGGRGETVKPVEAVMKTSKAGLG
jgi:hypothetical protein